MKTDVTFESALAAVGQKTSIAGASTTGFAWFFSNEFLGVMGLLVAVIGLVVNIYYRRRENARRQALHDATIAVLASGAVGLAAAIQAAPANE